MIGALRSFGSGVLGAVAARPDRVRAGVEVALGVLLALQLGRLVWIVAEPGPEPAPVVDVAVRPVDYSIFQRFDAFFRTGEQSSLAEASAAGSNQMRLFGLRSDGAGGGSAIIGLPDGRQVSVAVGEEVEPGLALRGVGPDHVTLARGTSVSRLIFSDTPVGAALPPLPPPGPQTVTPRSEPAVAPASVPAALMSQAGLRPRMRGARLDGFTVSETGDPAVLRAAGLRPGDVILAVDGQPLDSLDRIAALRARMATDDRVELSFERGGVVQTSILETSR